MCQDFAVRTNRRKIMIAVSVIIIVFRNASILSVRP